MKTVNEFDKADVINCVTVSKIVEIDQWAKATGFDLVSIARTDLHHYTVRGFKGNDLVDYSIKVICGIEVLDSISMPVRGN